MKEFVLNFKGFVNENFSEENFERAEELSDTSTASLPEEVSKIAKTIVDGNFEKHKVLGVEGDTIKLRATDQDFKYAPDTLALRDFGFEAWSSKPYDVKLTLDDADPNEREITYKIEYVEKNAERRKVDPDAGPEVGSDDDEYYKPEDYGDVPEEPEADKEGMVGDKDGDNFIDRGEFLDDDDEDEELMEGRKKKVSGGFAALKIKKAPKYSNPNNKARREESKKKKNSGFKKKDTKKILKKDNEKMAETKKDDDRKETD